MVTFFTVPNDSHFPLRPPHIHVPNIWQLDKLLRFGKREKTVIVLHSNSTCTKDFAGYFNLGIFLNGRNTCNIPVEVNKSKYNLEFIPMPAPPVTLWSWALSFVTRLRVFLLQSACWCSSSHAGRHESTDWRDVASDPTCNVKHFWARSCFLKSCLEKSSQNSYWFHPAPQLSQFKKKKKLQGFKTF